jgi:hypothetical protein
MSIKSNSLTEAAHIGEELAGGSRYKLDRQCMVVKQAVQDGDFTLEEALELYKVKPKVYEQFVAQNALEHIKGSFSGNIGEASTSITIEVLTEMFKSLFKRPDKQTAVIIKELENYSRDIRSREHSC